MSNHPRLNLPPSAEISKLVAASLSEDIGSGDITAALIPADATASAKIISRQQAVFCGRAWADEVLRQVDPNSTVAWQIDDGSMIAADQILVTLHGNSRSLLTAERSVLNFLQTLSATSTQSHNFAQLVHHTQCTLLDTRKTLPGMRVAQKYAVRCGGCENHRIGLFDAFLIKENHIQACGSISNAVHTARSMHPKLPLEIEVESIMQMEQALACGVDIVMLDNFSLEDLVSAVAVCRGRAKLEASGMVDAHSLVSIAETGVDYVSIGALTKNCQAIDLSMLFDS